MPLIPGGGRKRRRAAAGPQPDPGRRLMATDDFTYLGTYRRHDTDAVYGSGLTHRYVDGQFQLITAASVGGGVIATGERYNPLVNRPPDSGFGNNFNVDMITVQNQYAVSNFLGGQWSATDLHLSIWWEESQQRLWSAQAWDYPDAQRINSSAVLATRTLPASGACVWDGYRGLQGIGNRALYGKVQHVPTWYQTAHDLPEYVSLSGGYSSLVAAGAVPSMGPMFVFFPDPFTYPAMASITADASMYSMPSTDYVIGADCRSGVTAFDWYSQEFGDRIRDRGVRTSAVKNYHDGNQVGNSGYPPSEEPNAFNWVSPCPKDPRGLGRWVLGDSYHGSGTWIDNDAGTQSRYGIVMVASLCKEKAFYWQSALAASKSCLELHIYDPDDVAAVTRGEVDPWKIQPSSVRELTELAGHIPEFAMPFPTGATFDSVTNRLYILQHWGMYNAVYYHVYQLAA